METNARKTVRTYGRRTKCAVAASRDFLDSPSLVGSSTRKHQEPLSERSNNAGCSRTKIPYHRQKLSRNVFESPQIVASTRRDVHRISIALPAGSVSPQRAEHPSPFPAPSPRRTSPRKPQRTPVTPTPVAANDDLSLIFADLSLASIQDPQHQRSSRSPIEARKLKQQPAEITDQTRKYIDPLLDCKHVSKCIEDFQLWMDEREGLLSIRKIGEGSFGEVYRAQGGKDVVILKLMPLNASKGKGSRSFTSVDAASNEIRLLGRMSKVPGFVEFRGACVLQGTMPHQLVRQWNNYAQSGRTVESKNPSRKDSYAPTQLWLLIEMSDAGESLERGRYMPPGMKTPITSKSKEPYLPLHFTWDAFWQIAKALAKGEVFAMYEHRDLHLGNICVKNRADTVRRHQARQLLVRNDKDYHEEDSAVSCYGINNSGIEVTLIDYSLSRASLGPIETLAYDFKNDKALLRGKGDLQYDMYRYMAAIMDERPSSTFEPKTNVMWLHYVLRLLLEATHPSQGNTECEMSEILADLKDRIHPDARGRWEWASASDLIEMGLEQGWFLPAHVIDI